MVEHHCLAKTVQSKLRSVIRSAARKRIFPGKAADIDDVSAAAALEALKRLMRAVICAVEVDVDSSPPLIRFNLRNAAEYTHTRIVYQDVQTIEPLIDT